MMFSMHALVVTAAVLGQAAPVAPADAATGAERYVWDVSAVYANSAAWDADRTRVREGLEAIARYRGTLGGSARALADGLDAVSALRSLAGRMAGFGSMLEVVDTRSVAARERREVGAALEVQVEAAVSFLRHEVPAIGRVRLERWLRAEPRLARHRQRIHRLLSEAPHVPGPDALPVIESMNHWSRQRERLYNALNESDLGWPSITSGGTPTVLTPATYQFYRIRGFADSSAMGQAARALRERMATLRGAYAGLLVERIQMDLAVARHRGFESGIDALWFLRDGMPPGSAQRLAAAARDNLPLLWRYLELRRRAAGLARASYADIWTPPPGITRRFTVSEALDIAIASHAPFGPEVQARMRRLSAMPLLHLAPQPFKRTDFSIFIPMGGSPPYMVQTFRGDYRNARNLAGALAEMDKWQQLALAAPPDTRDDPAIFGNAGLFASNLMVDEYLKDRAADVDERRAYLIMSLDRIREVFYHEGLNASFEIAVEEMLRRDEEADGARLSALYLGLLREFYGHGRGGVAVESSYGVEWMARGVSFLSHEGQFWPAALAMGAAVFERVRAGDTAFTRRYLEAPAAASSGRSSDLLQYVGLDPSAGATYEALFQMMRRMLDELERSLPAPP